MGTMYRGHFALEVAARLAAARRDWPLAVRFQGAADVAVDNMGGMRTWFDDPVLKALQAQPAAMLDTSAYDAAYAEGRAMSLEQALGNALAWLDA
jgi:predicted aminopeptidase